MNRNNVAAAEPLVADILRVDNRNTIALRLRAAIRLDRGQTDDAISDLRTALNDQPQAPELLASLAIAYERSGSIELADKAFLDAMRASRFEPTYGLNYIAFLRRRGLADQAESVLTDLARRNPTNIAVLTALAQVTHAPGLGWRTCNCRHHSPRRGQGRCCRSNRCGRLYRREEVDSSLAALQSSYDANPGAAKPWQRSSAHICSQNRSTKQKISCRLH